MGFQYLEVGIQLQLDYSARRSLTEHNLAWDILTSWADMAGASSVQAEQECFLLCPPLAPHRRVAVDKNGKRRSLNEIMGDFTPLLHVVM